MEISIKVWRREEFFFENGYQWALLLAGLVRCCLESDFWDCCMGEVCERVNHDCQARSRPKFARFEQSRKCLCWEGYS